MELVLGFTVLGESKHNDVMFDGHSAPCSVLINTIASCPTADHEWEFAVAGGSALTASVAPAASWRESVHLLLPSKKGSEHQGLLGASGED